MPGMALVRLPTEGVEVDDHDALVAAGELSEIERRVDAVPVNARTTVAGSISKDAVPCAGRHQREP